MGKFLDEFLVTLKKPVTWVCVLGFLVSIVGAFVVDTSTKPEEFLVGVGVLSTFFVLAGLVPFTRGVLAYALGMLTFSASYYIISIKYAEDDITLSSYVFTKSTDRNVIGYTLILAGNILCWLTALPILAGHVASNVQERLKTTAGIISGVNGFIAFMLLIISASLYFQEFDDEPSEQIPSVQNGINALILGVVFFVAFFADSKFALWLSVFLAALFQYNFMLTIWEEDASLLFITTQVTSSTSVGRAAGYCGAIGAWMQILSTVLLAQGSSFTECLEKAKGKILGFVIITGSLALVVVGGILVDKDTHVAWRVASSGIGILAFLLSFVQSKEREQALMLVGDALVLIVSGELVSLANRADKIDPSEISQDENAIGEKQATGFSLAVLGIWIAFIAHGVFSYRTIEKLSNPSKLLHNTFRILALVGFIIGLVSTILWGVYINDNDYSFFVEPLFFIPSYVESIVLLLLAFGAMLIVPTMSRFVALSFFIGFASYRNLFHALALDYEDANDSAFFPKNLSSVSIGIAGIVISYVAQFLFGVLVIIKIAQYEQNPASISESGLNMSPREDN